MARRQRGEGGLYYVEKEGLWRGVVDLGWRDGTRRRKVVSSKNFKTAQKKLNDVKKQLAQHGDIPTRSITLEKWLRQWLGEIVFVENDPETYARYRANCERHIIPEIGRVRLPDKLQPKHVRQVHQRIWSLGLSDSTANSAHRTLSAALKAGMVEGVVNRNVCQLVEAPRVGTRDPVALDMDEVRRFLEIAGERNPRTAARWVSAFMIGPRQGETLALRLKSVDWGSQTMDIAWQLSRLPYMHGCNPGQVSPDSAEPPRCGRKRKADCPEARLAVPPGYECEQLYGRLCLTRPKNQKHLIPVPDPLFAALNLRRKEIEKERRHYVSDHGLIFCRTDGEPIAPEDDYDEWVDWLAVAEVPHVKLHAARITAATLLRMLGYSTDVIRLILGHASVLQTQAYTEIDMTLAREALAGYSDALALTTSVRATAD